MTPGGGFYSYFGRLFGHLVNYIMRGLGFAQAEQHFDLTYGTTDPAVFQQAWDQAVQAVQNTAALFGLGLDEPISTVLGGAQPPGPVVGVRALIGFLDANGGQHWRTIDTDVDWTNTAGFVYAAIAGRARDIAGSYDWRVQSIQIVPPLLFPLVQD